MNRTDLDLANQIAVNSGDIRDIMQSLIDEVAELRQIGPAADPEHGYVFYGPDGEWHWSGEECTNPEIEDQRPATSLEKSIFGQFGSTEALRYAKFDLDYHDLAMRTAAGPEVFHYGNNRERIMDVANRDIGDENDPQIQEEARGLINADFLVDMVEYLHAANKLDRWKSRFFYNKDKEIPTYIDVEGASLDHLLNPQILHAILGLATEGAELVDDLRKLMKGMGSVEFRTQLLPNIKRESGDIDWYQELLVSWARTYEPDARQVHIRFDNIERLRARFPAKFTEEDAVARADEQPAERGVPFSV